MYYNSYIPLSFRPTVGAHLAAWLNETPQGKGASNSHRRIVELHELLKAAFLAKRDLRSEINGRLKRYAGYARLIGGPPFTRFYFGSIQPQTKGHVVPVLLDVSQRLGKATSSIPFDERDAASSLIKMAEEGTLQLLRRCEHCKGWFFSRRKIQRFCKRECQQKSFKTSEEWKKSRREYMRNYRKHPKNQ